MDIGAITDINGRFELMDIPEGQHIIRCYYILYKTYEDTILVNDDIDLNIILQSRRITIEIKPEIENYHLSLEKFAEQDSLLTIHIDSLSYNKRGLLAYSTFNNLSTDTIYIIKECECFRIIEPIVYRDDEYVKFNCISLGCDIIPYGLINMTDLIKLSPGQSINYPPLRLWLYSFEHLPNGEYKIRIQYKFGGPSSLSGIFIEPEDDAILLALRGKFSSDNFVTFNNFYGE